MSSRKLIIVLGPTAVGKTDYSISLASKYSSPVISCDSRQLYREMTIGTAVPDREQLALVKHYFIQDHSIHDDIYTAGKYELEAVDLIERLFSEGHDTLVMSGGSCFYIDAVCNGLDSFPASDMSLRSELMDRLGNEGLESLRRELALRDPLTLQSIDINNSQRIVRALEVCIQTGLPFSSFKTAKRKTRSFEIEKIGLTRERNLLYERINERTGRMFRDGLVDEARSLIQWRNCPALQTVGYKEVFDHLDGLYDEARALELVRRNTRRYARRQMSWWGRDKSIRWVEL